MTSQKHFLRRYFHRAVNHLYKDETKSSYQIEREAPTPDRMDKFVSILEKAGEQSIESLLNGKNLIAIQNTTVDYRFAVPGYRKHQNFISSTNHIKEYDQILENYSKPLMRGIKFKVKEN